MEGASTDTDILRVEVKETATEVARLLKPGGPVISIGENAPSIVDDVSSAGDTWGPLLKKVEIFANAIDWVGDVCPLFKQST